MTEDEEILVALLVINDGVYTSSYKMCKFINRMFEIWDCEKIIAGLIGNKYVYYSEDDQVKNFSISMKGRDAVAKNRVWVIELLKKEFPEKINIIETL